MFKLPKASAGALEHSERCSRILEFGCVHEPSAQHEAGIVAALLVLQPTDATAAPDATLSLCRRKPTSWETWWCGKRPPHASCNAS